MKNFGYVIAFCILTSLVIALFNIKETPKKSEALQKIEQQIVDSLKTAKPGDLVFTRFGWAFMESRDNLGKFIRLRQPSSDQWEFYMQQVDSATKLVKLGDPGFTEAYRTMFFRRGS